jgi:hypothetical protein
MVVATYTLLCADCHNHTLPWRGVTPTFLDGAARAVRPSRHQAVLEELGEWWQEISAARIGSRVVLSGAYPAGGTKRPVKLAPPQHRGGILHYRETGEPYDT